MRKNIKTFEILEEIYGKSLNRKDLAEALLNITNDVILVNYSTADKSLMCFHLMFALEIYNFLEDQNLIKYTCNHCLKDFDLQSKSLYFTLTEDSKEEFFIDCPHCSKVIIPYK